MLAAYGFFYNAYKSRIDAAGAVGAASPDETLLDEQIATVQRGRSAAIGLAIVALVVWLLFLKQVVDEIDAAIDVHFDLDRYSTLDVVFAVLANAWLGIAIAVGLQAEPLSKKLRELKEEKPKPAS